MSTWQVHAFEMEAMAADFPYARSLIVVRSQRTNKKSGVKCSNYKALEFGRMEEDLKENTKMIESMDMENINRHVVD